MILTFVAFDGRDDVGNKHRAARSSHREVLACLPIPRRRPQDGGSMSTWTGIDVQLSRKKLI